MHSDTIWKWSEPYENKVDKACLLTLVWKVSETMWSCRCNFENKEAINGAFLWIHNNLKLQRKFWKQGQYMVNSDSIWNRSFWNKASYVCIMTLIMKLQLKKDSTCFDLIKGGMKLAAAILEFLKIRTVIVAFWRYLKRYCGKSENILKTKTPKDAPLIQCRAHGNLFEFVAIL